MGAAYLLNPIAGRHFLNETIMAESEFDAPVRVALGPDKTVRIVLNAAEAIACLSNIYWPKAGKQCWREAARCMQAWRGYRTEEDARLAFIAAAQAADVLMSGIVSPQASRWRRKCDPEELEKLRCGAAVGV